MTASLTTQLARVVDLSPLLLPLDYESIAADEASPLLAVKIRSTLLHILIGNRLWCVVVSKVPITDVTNYCSHAFNGLCQVLVSTQNGDVWIVTLPKHVQLAMGCVVAKLTLENSLDKNNDGSVQWFCRVPGVLSMIHTPAGHGLTSFTLVMSLVTPSTFMFNTRGKAEQQSQSHQSLELDELEGEQATCILCLNGQVASHSKLLWSLFPDVANDSEVIVILQGDLDGWVRFSLVRLLSNMGDCAKADVIRNGTLLQLSQPVQMIIPFSSSVPCTVSLEENDATPASQLFDALLVLGARGRIGVINSKNIRSFETLSAKMRTLELERSVQSIVFVRSLAVFILCSSGSAFVCRSLDMLVKAQRAESKPILTQTCVLPTEKLPLGPGIIRLAIHGRKGGLVILFASGRIVTIDETALHNMVSSVLPSHERKTHLECSDSTTPDKLASESRVRNLLHRIAQVTTESTALRTRSKQMDIQLKTLHSAFEMLRAVEAASVESVVECDLRAMMVKTGTFSDRYTIQLVCSFRFVHSDAIVSLNHWSLCLYVRVHQRAVTTYSFPLKEIVARGEQIIDLDLNTLAQQDQGSLWVSCSMVFCLSLEGMTKNEKVHQFQASPINSHEKPLAFAIPVFHDKRILFAQLIRPVEEETIASQVAIHAAFRQQHVPFMPAGRAISERKTETQMSTLWAGVQWCAALAEHAQKTPSFATLWSKIGSSHVALSPPSRFVVSIPSFFGTKDNNEEDSDGDDVFEEACIERVVSFLRQLLDTPANEVPRLRRSCRIQHGKLWMVLQALSGSLILLRFTPSEDQSRSVDLTIQCSDVADLSAMRALVLDATNKWSDKDHRGMKEVDRLGEKALDSSERAEPIVALENLLEDLTFKIKRIVDPSLATCTEDVHFALSQLVHLETQTLALYWKSRVQVNTTIV